MSQLCGQDIGRESNRSPPGSTGRSALLCVWGPVSGLRSEGSARQRAAGSDGWYGGLFGPGLGLDCGCFGLSSVGFPGPPRVPKHRCRMSPNEPPPGPVLVNPTEPRPQAHIGFNVSKSQPWGGTGTWQNSYSSVDLSSCKGPPGGLTSNITSTLIVVVGSETSRYLCFPFGTDVLLLLGTRVGSE